MKKIFTLLTLVVATLVSATAERCDTVVTLVRPDSVVVTIAPASLSVKTGGQRYGQSYTYEYTSETEEADISSGWDIALPFTRSLSDNTDSATRPKRKARRWSTLSFEQLYVGLTRSVDAPDGMRGGWEIGLSNILGLRYIPVAGGPAFTLGMGMGYRSANVSHGAYLDVERGVVSLVPTSADMKASSRIHIFRLEFPLMLKQTIYRGLAVKVGGILNLNTYMKATTKTTVDGRTGKVGYKGLHQRFATIDLYGAIGFSGNMSLYARYSPARVFDTCFGPDFNQLSFGITFGF